MSRRAAVGVLAVLGGCLAGPGFTTCPKATPCYDMRLEKCKAADPTITNGAGLIYCDVRLTGSCDDKTVCYDFASGCVCEGNLPCHSFNGVCQAWTEQCSPKNVHLQWCPSSPPPVPTTPPPTPPPTTSTTSSPSPTPRPTTSTTPTSPATTISSSPDTITSSSPATTKSSSSARTNTSGTTTDAGSLATYAQTGSDAGTTDTLGIVVAIGAVVVVVAVIAAFVILRRRSPQSPPYTPSVFASYNDFAPPNDPPVGQPYAATPFYSTAQKPSTQSRGHTQATASTTSTMSFSRQEDASGSSLDISELDLHRIAPQELDLVKVEASGGYGEVLLAEYQGRSVAVKRLLPSKRSTRTEVAKFIDEIKLHAKMDCPYIVAFVGAAWSKPTDIMMVTEFMENGDLRGYLQRTNPQTFEWPAKVENALDIAHGLVYLHTLDPTVIHRDLKSRNVLLNKAFQCKLTDFGVSREFEDMQTMTAGIGTYRWMAPEVLQDGHYAASADIFSFGVIMAELDTHLLPYEGVVNDRGNPLTDTAIMAKVMNGELRPSFSATCPRWFSDLGNKCLSLDPSDRPTAMEIAYTIKVQLRSGAL